MKYIRSYEDINYNSHESSEHPQVGDYVIMRSTVDEVRNFIENNIGQILHIDREDDYLTVKYFNIPTKLKEFLGDGPRYFGYKLIKHWSKNKKELEAFLDSNKYNL